jgi:hypothetical protein
MPRRPTKDPHTRPAIFTLERLHAELGGQILENRQRHEELSHQMRHVEAVIKMLDPSYNLGRITVKRRKPNKWFKRGTLYRRAMDVLRTATEAMTAMEIGTAVLKFEGIEASPEDARSVSLGIQHSLKNHEGKGVRRTNDGSPAKWSLVGNN